MKVSLRILRGSQEGKDFRIRRSPFLIGRDPKCHLRPSDPCVSRRHCALIILPDRVILRDFGSTNGTLVNGQQVVNEMELHDGDELRMHGLAFMVCVEKVPLPADAPPVPARSASEAADDEAISALLLEMQQKPENIEAAAAGLRADGSVMDRTVLDVNGLPPAP